jgi:hypothetical protein
MIEIEIENTKWTGNIIHGYGEYYLSEKDPDR